MSSFAPTTTCPNGHLVEDGAGFCAACGYAIAPAPMMPATGQAARLECPNGHPIAAGSAFCPNCGSAVIQLPFTQSEAWTQSWATPSTANGHRAAETPSRKRLFIALGVVSAVVVASVVVVLVLVLGATPTTTVNGSFELNDSDTASADCTGQGGYADIEPGTTVILSDETGKVLGSGVLDSGVADIDAGTCTYGFSIPDIPKDAKQYVFEVSDRGKVISTNAEMSADGWFESMTLGD